MKIGSFRFRRWNTSFRFKMFSRISIMLLLVILLMCLIIRDVIVQRLAADQVQLQLLKTSSKLDTLDNYMMTLMVKTDSLFANEEFTNLIELHPTEAAEYVAKSQTLQKMMDLTVFNLRYPEVSISNYTGGQVSGCLYVRQLGLYPDGQIIRSFSEIENEPYIRDLMNETRTFIWNSGRTAASGSYIAFNRRILSYNDLSDIAILQMRIPVNKILTVLNPSSEEYLVSLFYLDPDGNLICNTGNPGLLDSIRDLPADTAKVMRLGVSGKEYVVNCVQSGLNGYRLIAITSIEPVQEAVAFITPICLIAGVLAVTMACLMLFFLSSSLLKGMCELVAKAQIACSATDKYEQLAPIRDTIEIEELDDAYARMVSTINRLHDLEARNQELLNQVQIELLQEQFNPHLLYNTLSMIRFLEESSGQTKICAVLDHLIAFYRQVLNRGQLITHVRDELNMTANYMSIVREVYDIDLTSTISVADDALDCCTVKMFLQPIVENAVLHGVRQMGSGAIAITGVRQDDTLCFTITDDGAGMEPATLERIRQQLNSPSGGEQGYGYVSVAKRLRLFFGDAYRMELTSELGEGTCVKLYIPALREDQISDTLRSRMI